MNEVAVKAPNPLVALNDQLEKRVGQFQAALPAHIPVERFKRVILTAVQQNPALATADRQTLWNSAMKAAQDGLLPDGREAALVIYKTKVKENNREFWIEAVQYMPMIAGLRKKVRNSGEIATWDAYVVYEKDQFEYELGDEPYIKHKPFLGGDPGKPVAAYSVATLKSGEKSREVMTISQIEKIRLLSRAKDRGPWVDHYSEMCRKTVARRHSKVLPMSTDLDDLIRRDDDLYDFKESREADAPARPKLSDFASAPMNAPVGQSEQDPAEQHAPAAADGEAEAESSQSGVFQDDASAEPSPADAYRLGRETRMANRPRRVPPEIEAQGEGFKDAWLAGWNEAEADIEEDRKAKKP